MDAGSPLRYGRNDEIWAALWSRQLLSEPGNRRCGVKPKPAAEHFSNLQDFGIGGGFELAGINRHRQHGVVPDRAS